LGLIEKYGSGIGRIIRYFKEANLPEPQFDNISGGFQVTVFLPDNVIVAVSNVTDKFTDNVTHDAENVTDGTKNVTDGTKNVTDVIEKFTDDTECVIENTKNVIEEFAHDTGCVIENTKGVIEKFTDDTKNVIDNREQEILKLIDLDNRISTKQLSEKLNVNIRTVFRYIEKLKAKGLIERIGADRGGYWKVKEK
jgi:ATP-dependent DNA helicase RecG